MNESAISLRVAKRHNTACLIGPIRIGYSSSDFAKIGNYNACTVKVKSAYEPSGPLGRSLSWLL